MKREEIVEVAREWLNVKWAHMGRNRQGVDCIGLVMMVGDKFEVPYENIEGNYRRTPDGTLFVDHFKKQMVPVRPPLKLGMAVLLRDETQPVHVGIIGEKYGKLTLIHSCARHGYVFEEPWKNWEMRFRMALDFPGVED